jgi:F-type H+-transporting ATPase subunit a
MYLLALIQEGAEHAAEAAEGGGGHHEAISPITQAVNAVLGPVALAIENAVMPPLYHLLGLHWTPPDAHEAIPQHVVMAVISLLICTVGLKLLMGKLSVDNPGKGQQMIELFVSSIGNSLDEVVGPYGRRYLAVIAAFAFFILISNLMGLVPLLDAPTANFNVTLALGVCSFLYYITRGFSQQGIGYLKHFTGGVGGPLIVFGVLIFFVEIVSNCLRPVTLGVRLFLNMFADHTIGGIVSNIVPGVTQWVFPLLLPIPLAAFVSFVQTLVFVMLSMVYLSETVPHEDHEHDHDAHGEGHAAHAH